MTTKLSTIYTRTIDRNMISLALHKEIMKNSGKSERFKLPIHLVIKQRTSEVHTICPKSPRVQVSHSPQDTHEPLIAT